MSKFGLVEKLAHALSERMRPSILLAMDLWDIATVAQHLKRNTKVTRERVVVLPDFLKAIRLSTAKGGAPPYPLQSTDDAVVAVSEA